MTFLSGTVTHNLLKLAVWPSGTCQRCIVLGIIGGRNLEGFLWRSTTSSFSFISASSAPVLELAGLAAALPLCETANEKEWRVITGWGLITCTVSHSWQPH